MTKGRKEGNTREKTRAQIFMERELCDPEVAKSFYEGLEELRLSANSQLS